MIDRDEEDDGGRRGSKVTMAVASITHSSGFHLSIDNKKNLFKFSSDFFFFISSPFTLSLYHLG